jgi:hypothetical protein
LAWYEHQADFGGMKKRPGEKSFGISRLDSVAVLNVHRLIYRDADVGWNIVTSHLLLVQHWAAAPAAIRQQACDVLDHILLIAPRNVTTGSEELQRRIQSQVLEALASQAEFDLSTLQSQTSTDIGIRRGALETLFKILEVNGHSFVCGWELVFGLLRSACPSYPDRALSDSAAASVALQATQVSSTRTPVLIRASFPSLQLICTDFLGSLKADELRLCVSTLADYGKQPEDVNVALTVSLTTILILPFRSLMLKLKFPAGWRPSVAGFGPSAGSVQAKCRHRHRIPRAMDVSSYPAALSLSRREARSP